MHHDKTLNMKIKDYYLMKYINSNNMILLNKTKRLNFFIILCLRTYNKSLSMIINYNNTMLHLKIYLIILTFSKKKIAN